MSVFKPRTMSCDWEVLVLDQLDRPLDFWKMTAFSGALTRELDLPIMIDDMSLEMAPGVNESLEELWANIVRMTDRATEMLAEYGLIMAPCGSSPVHGAFFASHVHVGTIYDEAAATWLESQMMPFMPAFGALAANSPFHDGRVGEYKSRRIQHNAHWCTVPTMVRDPHLSRSDWYGADASSRVCDKPTMEMRIVDCASSRRFLAEAITFIAAFLHEKGKNVDERPPTRCEYREGITNRWSASRHGLQATFLWDGVERPAVDVLEEMLDFAAPGLKALGAKRSDLGLVNKMLRKRVTQADFAMGLTERYSDPILLASAYSKVMRHWDAFDGWLAKAKPLKLVPAPDENAILDAHLRHVGDETPVGDLGRAMHYPAPVIEELVARMVDTGMVTRRVVPKRGVVLSRTKATC